MLSFKHSVGNFTGAIARKNLLKIKDKSINFFQDLLKYILQGGFVILDIVFGCDNPTYNPSPVWELSLLTQFSGITTLQSLVLEKQCKGAWPVMVLSMRSDNLTHNPSPSSY